MRILIVDDERQITRVLRTSLQSSGYEVTVANNGLEAFELFTSTQPDLVITDLAMPEMTGIELTRAIRRTSETPIIILSVREQETMKVAALDEGAVRVLLNHEKAHGSLQASINEPKSVDRAGR